MLFHRGAAAAICSFDLRIRWLCVAASVIALCGAAGALAAEPADGEPVQSLFDGKSLAGWKKTAFGGEGDVEVRDGQIILQAGNPMTGITWTANPPRMDYEITLEAMRRQRQRLLLRPDVSRRRSRLAPSSSAAGEAA